MEQPPKKSWFGRNWFWVLPIGCLMPFLCCGGFVTAILFTVSGAIKSSEVYTQALERARTNKDAIAILGEPIEPSFMPMGSFEINNQFGKAEIVVPLTGPKGTAVLEIRATKNAGPWEYSKLTVSVPNGPVIDLREAPKQ